MCVYRSAECVPSRVVVVVVMVVGVVVVLVVAFVLVVVPAVVCLPSQAMGPLRLLLRVASQFPAAISLPISEQQG